MVMVRDGCVNVVVCVTSGRVVYSSQLNTHTDINVLY